MAGASRRLFTIYYSLFTVFPFLPLLDSLLKTGQLVGDIAVAHIDAVNFRESVGSASQVAHGFVSRAKFILERLRLLGAASRGFEAFLKPKHRRLRHALLDKAVAQHVTAMEISWRAVG